MTDLRHDLDAQADRLSEAFDLDPESVQIDRRDGTIAVTPDVLCVLLDLYVERPEDTGQVAGS